MADEDVRDQHDIDLDAIWADVWNPESNQWSPSQEPYPKYGADASQVEYQAHEDIATALTMSESYGQAAAGTIPDSRMNVLTDVAGPPTSAPPPRQVIEHEVSVSESGAEVCRVRQIVVTGSTPMNLIEENPSRKRALLRILTDSPVTTFSGNAGAATITVPAGQTWVNPSIWFAYVASAVAGNRTVIVRVRDSFNRVLYEAAAPLNIAANQTGNFSVAGGLPFSGGGGAPTFSITMPFPDDLVLGPGYTVQITATGSDAGDSIGGQLQFTGTGTVFIAPRAAGGGAAQASAWFALNVGDAPLEVKTQQGLDVDANGGTYTIHVYEELSRGENEQALTGIV